ncbi:4-fold beta flower protein [Desulfotalea psychrophila]|uniref:4-fold beta flower protein n=1 Tax=Desulfotalea psychrophila TaxID=84980 RepID=UPI00059BFC30|nr:hypothetical protein [Desulfotalea psychrophila]
MTPIYGRDAELTGWYDGMNIFSLDLDWLAFHNDGNLFSAHNLKWLGPVDDGLFLDREGKPVAWIEDCTPSTSTKPIKPPPPSPPAKPFKPLQPIDPTKPLKALIIQDGWSTLTWQQWLKA